jgi:MarR family transcriptional regulator, organic hydroperoxide resistance regulator
MSKSYGEAMQRLNWEINSMSAHLDELDRQWAKRLGISGPQWTIITGISYLDKGDGVAVGVVAKMLQVDGSFITTQSKRLEEQGFIRRKVSARDARVVKMSITDKVEKGLMRLAEEREALDEFIFAEFSPQELLALVAKLSVLKIRLEKACLKVVAEF